MKKLFIYTLGLVALTTSCRNNDLQEQIPLTDEVQEICATIKQLEFEQSDFSRTSITIKEDGPHYAWAETDTIGIFPNVGRQVEFSMKEGAGSTSAKFTGGGWGLKSTSTYAAYYPLIGKYYLDKTAIPVDYTGQLQDGNGTTTHLGAYDYLAAPASDVNNGTVSFNFERLGCLVRLIVTIPEPATLSKLTLKCPQYSKFIEKGTINLSADEVVITPTDESQTLEINLSNIATTKSNEQVTIYFMTAPVDLSNKSLAVTIDFEDGTSYETEVAGKNLEAGKAYALEEVDKRLFNHSTVAIKPVQDSDGTYLIKSASNMKWFMKNCELEYSRANYKLTTDIVINTDWEPIYSFSGTFDGGGHVIENVKFIGRETGCYAIFAYLSGTVKNLVFKNPYINQYGDNDYYNLYAGVVAGKCAGGSILNCGVIGGTIYVASTSRATAHGGGVIGEIIGNNTIVKGCFVVGTKLSGSSSVSNPPVGALIGSVHNAKNVNITSCYSKDVTVSGVCAGTFIGRTYVLTDNMPSTITSCYYDTSNDAIGSTSSETFSFTINSLVALTDANFAEAITNMNVNLTDCEYIFGESGSFVKQE